ncbi:MAG: FAD-dependent oxidoreductase, partial [Cobetia crustatorum]
ISTSLPFDTQLEVVRSIRGMENAHITRPGYAIEYDFFNPQDLLHSLETRFVKNLFFAGQINGTTGYEEAGAQGLLAGVNAALRATDDEAWHPLRNEAYTGVMVDDLITLGTREPYRMFTSRAEYRLLLREDNADLRLTEKGRELGLIDDARWAAFEAKRDAISRETTRLESTWLTPSSPELAPLADKLSSPLKREASLMELLKRPELEYPDVASLKGQGVEDWRIAEQVQITAKYAGYIQRQQEEIDRLRRHENTALPEGIDYDTVDGLSNEIKQKLNEARPVTLAHAGRISGVTPAAVSILLIHMKKRQLLKTDVAAEMTSEQDVASLAVDTGAAQ